MDGELGIEVTLIAERKTEKLLRVFNEVNRNGKIPAIWKAAMVLLIPKPGKDPTFPSNKEKQEHSEYVVDDRGKDGGKSGSVTERIIGPGS